MGDQLERCAVGPVEVLEHEQDRLPGGEALEQLAHRVVDAEALGGRGGLLHRVAQAVESGEDARELADAVAGESLVCLAVERREVGSTASITRPKGSSRSYSAARPTRVR